VRHAGAAHLQDGHIRLVDPHAVRSHGAAAKHAETIQGLGGSHVALGQLVVVFLFRLGDVDQQRSAILVGEGPRGLERLIGVGVNRVRCYRRNHQRIVAVVAPEKTEEKEGQ